MEIHTGDRAPDFETSKHLLRSTLITLNKVDPGRSDCMDRDPSSQGWQFEFDGVGLFVSLFAPCYPELHPKYSYNVDKVFIFFQPEVSFDFCGINQGNQNAKEHVRELFQNSGRPYNGQMIDRRIEGFLYMTPLGLTDPPVRGGIDLSLRRRLWVC